MFKLKAKNNKGELLDLSGSPFYTVYKIDGLTPPKATINTTVNTTSDGSKINSVRVENRNIVIYMTIEGDVEKNRIKLYRYFPPKKSVSIYFQNGTRNVYIEGVVELVECDLFARKQVAQISILCPQPYFKAAEKLVASFGDVQALFSFPFSIPAVGMEFSTLSANVRKSIINTGDVDAGLVIENPVLYNVLTGEHMRFGLTLSQSDKIVINTNVGEKSVKLIREGVTSNAMGLMSPDSSWFTLVNGDNVFTYDAAVGTSSLQITFSTNLLYGGV